MGSIKLSAFPKKIIDETSEVIGTREENGVKVNAKFNIGDEFKKYTPSVVCTQAEYSSMDHDPDVLYIITD